MAEATPVAIVDTWEELRANPVFRRSMLPRSLRGVVRSPLPRALLLTAVAIGILHWFTRTVTVVWPAIVAVVLFWFLVEAMQRYFCWVELTALARSGTLDDYVNSGLSHADVAMGVIYPAVIAERVAIMGVMLWYLLMTESALMRGVLIAFIALQAAGLFRPPWLMLPDVETYMRKRNPVALFFISASVLVPLLIWFAICFGLLFVLTFVTSLLGLGFPADWVVVGSILLTYLVSRVPLRSWETWRLKRFYSRYASFDDLFERYFDVGGGA